MGDLGSEVAALPGMSARQLRAAWRALRCGEPMAPSSRDLLIREIAYKLQERAHGGLAPATRRHLRAVVGEIATKAGADVLISNHSEYDGSKTKLPAVQARKPGDPNPYVVGTDSVRRYMKIAEECSKAWELRVAK